MHVLSDHPTINTVLDNLLFYIRQIFQERLVGLYLHGSLVTGDFDPAVSDIDLLAATSTDITASEFNALRAMHEAFASANPEWDDRLDVVYLSVPALAAFRTETGPILISPGEPFHKRDAEPLKDWLQEFYSVRESSVVLFGPPPGDIIPPMTHDEFIHAIRRYAEELTERVKTEQSRKAQAYLILSMCRALHVCRTGKQASKKQAALWAQQEMPEWSALIRSALEWRQRWREEHINHAATYPETIRFVNFAKSQILA